MTADNLFVICVATMAGIVIGQLGKLSNFLFFGVLLALTMIIIFF